jgi:hypothetical protein
MYLVRHCIYQVPHGAIAGNAGLDVTVRRVAGMIAGYIYSKNKEASE